MNKQKLSSNHRTILEACNEGKARILMLLSDYTFSKKSRKLFMDSYKEWQKLEKKILDKYR